MSEAENSIVLRRSFSGAWRFAAATRTLDRLLPADKVEVAFAGRSNVGKSSLMNSLTSQANLARTSHTPGRTQEIIFFESPQLPELRLVDLPGYGYAKVAKTLKRDWGRLIMQYLIGRPTLARVYLLIDGRRGAAEQDILVMKALDKAAVSYQIIVTKSDKLKGEEQTAIVDKLTTLLRKHPAAYPEVLMTSSQNKIGIEALQTTIVGLAQDQHTDQRVSETTSDAK